MSEDLGYTFGEDAAREIIATVQALRSQVEQLSNELADLRSRSAGGEAVFYVCKAKGEITAFDSDTDTLGSGTVGVYRPSGTDDTIGTEQVEIDVLNSAGAVADGTVCGIQRGAWGKWYVTVEAC